MKKTNFKRGQLVTVICNEVLGTSIKNYTEEIYVESNKTTSNCRKLMGDYVTLIFKIKGKYNPDKHSYPIGGAVAIDNGTATECRIDVEREFVKAI